MNDISLHSQCQARRQHLARHQRSTSIYVHIRAGDAADVRVHRAQCIIWGLNWFSCRRLVSLFLFIYFEHNLCSRGDLTLAFISLPNTSHFGSNLI